MFTHRHHCANRRRRPGEHTFVPCSPCSCAKRAAAAKRSNRPLAKRYQVELYNPGRPRSNLQPVELGRYSPHAGHIPYGKSHPCGWLRSTMVGAAGFEPARACARQLLRLARLPVPPRPDVVHSIRMANTPKLGTWAEYRCLSFSWDAYPG